MKIVLPIIFLPLVLIFGCNSPQNQTDKTVSTATPEKVFFLSRLSDDLVYGEGSIIELKFLMDDQGDVSFINENQEAQGFNLLSNSAIYKKQANEEIRYTLKRIAEAENQAALTLTVYEKDQSGAFTKRKMNMGSITLDFDDQLDLETQINNYLALATYKCCYESE